MIEIREVKEIKEAEKLWRNLSPHKTIFDEWDFRYCFYKYDLYPINFLAAWEKKEGIEDTLVGLMPLQLNPENFWEFFAEDPSEENRPFIKEGYEKIIPDLYAAIPSPAKCYDITGEDEFTKKLALEDYIYFLPLRGLSNYEDYLKSRLSAKKQRNFRSDMRQTEVYRPEIIKEDLNNIKKDAQIITSLFALNNANFSDSYLQSDKDQGAWLDLLTLPYNWQVIGIKINGRLEAASLAVLYQGTYFYLINGANSAEFSGLGKYLNKVNLEAAISLGADYFDAGLGDCNWKAAWHFDKLPQYLFKR